MTNFSALSDFFADRDVSELRALGESLHGIDVAGVYCLHTGRKVGTFDDFVIQFAIDEESTDDDEDLVDALVSRCVAAMRPTPMLNKPDRVTLLNLAEKYPVDVVCFLINRLHSNRHLHLHRDSSVLAPYLFRITNHKLWTEMAADGVDVKPWIHWLLELDSKRNLHDLTPPTGEYDRTGKWIETKTGESLFAQINQPSAAEFLAIFEEWTFARIKEFDARDREALAQDKWMRGNTMTQPAYARSWLENPQFAGKRYEQEAKAKNKPERVTKPKSVRATKVDAKVSQFLHLLDGIIDGDTPVETPKKAGPKLLTGASLSFLKKKES